MVEQVHWEWADEVTEFDAVAVSCGRVVRVLPLNPGDVQNHRVIHRVELSISQPCLLLCALFLWLSNNQIFGEQVVLVHQQSRSLVVVIC